MSSRPLPAKLACRFNECLPTRLVGKVLGNGTEPCRLAGDADRLPGALVDCTGKSAAPEERVADAPFASGITIAASGQTADPRWRCSVAV